MRRVAALALTLALLIPAALAAEPEVPDWAAPFFEDACVLELMEAGDAARLGEAISPEDLAVLAQRTADKLALLDPSGTAAQPTAPADNTRGEVVRALHAGLTPALPGYEQDPVEALQTLGVLQGDGRSLALDRTCTRQEAMVMAVRLLRAEYGAKGVALTPTTFTLTFAGDVMLADNKGRVVSGRFQDYANRQPPAYFLEGVQSYFATDDYTFVNLENVLTDQPLTERDKGTGTNYWYKGPTSNGAILTAGSVEGVSLSNNHTNDYDAEGYADTGAALEALGVDWGDKDHIVYVEKDGFRVAIVCSGMWGSYHVSGVLANLEKAKAQSDFQVVFFHGGTERIHAPEQWKKDACHRLVDAGADLVLGGHPHVLQPRESYNGVDIVYSLGNFCYGGNSAPENATVLYRLTLTVENGVLLDKSGEVVPCLVYSDKNRSSNYRPEVLSTDSDKGRAILDFMDWKRGSPV